MLEELERDILVAAVVIREPQRHLQHVEAVLRHPRRPVGLLEQFARGQHRRAVEDADVVEAEKAALEDIVPEGILAVNPPGEIDQQLVESTGEELEVVCRRRCETP